MANEIAFDTTDYTIQHTLRAILFNPQQQVWNGKTFAPLSSTTATAAAFLLALLPGSSSIWTANAPILAAGSYSVLFVDSASPAYDPAVGQQFLWIQAAYPTPTAPSLPATPIGSSADAAARIRQQIADLIALKEQALYAIANINGVWAAGIGGTGPSYTIASNDGSKTVSMTEFLNYLRGLITDFANLEKMLFQLLQDLTPYDIVSHVHIGGWVGGGW